MHHHAGWGLTVAKVSLLTLGLISLTTSEALSNSRNNRNNSPSVPESSAQKSNPSTQKNSQDTSGSPHREQEAQKQQETRGPKQSSTNQSKSSSQKSQPQSSNKSDSSESALESLSLSQNQQDLLVQTACTSAQVTAGGVGYTACRGAFEGNDTGAGNPLLTLLNGGLFAAEAGSGTWTQLGKSDGGQFKADEGATSGSWSLLTGQKLSGTFVLSLKANNFYSAYLFSNLSDITEGNFETIGVSTNKKGMAQGLSHASLFYLEGSAPPINNPNPEPVPEPMTLMGTGLAAVFGYRFKHKRDQKNAK